MTFDIHTPDTWTDLGLPPFFSGVKFNREWYDGDVDKYLILLRSACSKILGSCCNYQCSLVVEDDCTFFASFYKDNTLVVDICPTRSISYQRCLYFFFYQHLKVELVVPTAEEAKEVMCAVELNSDLSEYNDEF